MREVWPYLKAVFDPWWKLMSCAVFTLVSIVAVATHRSNDWIFWVSIALALAMFLIGSYLAWRKEYRTNEEHRANETDRARTESPSLLMEWETPDGAWVHDTLKLINAGTVHSLELTFHRFSNPALSFSHEIHVPSLAPGESISIPVEIQHEWARNSISVVHLKNYMLNLPEGKTSSLEISYSNLHSTRFTTEFELWLHRGRVAEVRCRAGKTTVIQARKA